MRLPTVRRGTLMGVICRRDLGLCVCVCVCALQPLESAARVCRSDLAMPPVFRRASVPCILKRRRPKLRRPVRTIT